MADNELNDVESLQREIARLRKELEISEAKLKVDARQVEKVSKTCDFEFFFIFIYFPINRKKKLL